MVRKELSTNIIWENDDFLVFTDNTPVAPGHILIIPKEHIENIFALSDGLYEELFKTAKALSAPLQRAMSSKRIGAAIEGFGVAHAHLHLVPINKDHDLDSNNAVAAEDGALAEIAEKIRKEIEKEKVK
jgi:histidine triad (HIT) family protein